MKVISLGSDRKLFEEDSPVRQRIIEYGKFFEETHIVVFTPNDGKFSFQKLSGNIFLYPTKSKIRALFILDFLTIIKKILKNSGNTDLVLTCQDPFETGLVGALARLAFGLPLHIQIHTDLMHKYFWQASTLNKLRVLISEFVIKYSDRVRVVSERVRKTIGKFNKNIDVLPIKVELKEGKAERRKGLEREGEINILTICRLEKEKNIKTAIKAFKIASQKFPEITFTIVGDGSQRKNLELEAEALNLKEKIKFAGWQNDLEKYYREADIYISPSLYEGYGMAGVEAATWGLPLLLSDTGLAGDVFEDEVSALICDALDTESFAGNILKLAQNSRLADEMGEKAREAVYKHLQLTNYLEKYADSIKKSAEGFKKSNFWGRILDFKITFFNSFIYLRYFICGVTAAAINISSLYIFTEKLGIWYLYSSVLAFLASLVISFVLQKFVVFKDNGIGKMHRQFSKFFAVAVLGVISNTVLVYIFTDILSVWYIVSQIIAGIFVMVQNYLLYKYFIFKPTSKDINL